MCFSLMNLLVSLSLAVASAFGQAEVKPSARTEKIRDVSPDGKFAFRIQFDGPLNELMQGKNAPAKGGIYSETIESLTVVSLPAKKVVADLTDAAFEGGNHFEEITFLWSADSKWCAFYFTYPRVGYTVAFHLRGGKFTRAHSPYELENREPVRWLKPGVLELRSEDAPAQTATFDGAGGVTFAKKKRR